MIASLLWAALSALAAGLPEVIEPPPSQYPPERYAKVAVLQWAHSGYAPVPATPAQAEAHKARNRAELADWAERARASGAELVVTPEFGVTGYPETADGEDQFRSPSEVAPYAETVPGPSTRYFGRVAARLGMYVQFDLAEKDGKTGLFYNASVVMDPSGALAGRYRKRNLFAGERDFLKAGRGTAVLRTPFGRVGLMICADVYHGPTISDYKAAGVDALLVSAAWTVPGAITSFQAVARRVGAAVVAANLADYPDSGVVNPDGTLQSHIRETRGLAFGYLPRR